MSLIDCLEGLTAKSSANGDWTPIVNAELGTYDSLCTYEIWVRTGRDPLSITEDAVKQEDATRKLLKTPTDSDIIGGIKILVFKNWNARTTGDNPKAEVLRDAMGGLGLPVWIPARLFTHAFFCDPTNRTIERTSPVRRYWQRYRGGFLLWSYDTSLHTSRVIYLSREDDYWIAFKQALMRCKSFVSLPMLPGVIGYMQQVQVSVSYIYRVRTQIDKLLKSIDDSLVVVGDDDSSTSQLDADDKTWTYEQLKYFEFQTRQLVRSAQEATRAVPYLTDNTGNLSRICNSLVSIRAENEAYHEAWKVTSREKASQAEELSGVMEDMMIELKSQMLAADWIFTKIDSLIKNTNLTINRADQRSNIQIANSSHTIAVESKRDNLSMMTIAAITMIFLPGTFVASLFAMPLLDWTPKDSTKIVQSGFWIYWAVTVPLTILTVLLWLTWFLRAEIVQWWRGRRQQHDHLSPSNVHAHNMNPNQLNGVTILGHPPRPFPRTKTIDWSNP